MDYFDTLVMYSFMLTLKPSRSLKIFISKQVYVVNLHSTVMALYFGDTRCIIRTSPMGWSQHQHLRYSIWHSQRGRCCTESISTSMLLVPSAVFLSTVNVGVATGLLVTYLYSTVSPRKAVSSLQG